MIIQVTGKTRAGKTSLVTAMILNEFMRFRNLQYQASCKYTKFENKKYGTNLTLPPQRHVVSANFDIYRKFPSMKSYPISGFEFGVPNKYQESVKKLIPYGVYAFDESNRYWDSKDTRGLPPWVTQVFEWSGHIFLIIFLITQRYIRLSPDIRGIVDKFIYVEKSIHTFKVGKHIVKSDKFIPGKLIKTEWYGREFQYEGEIEVYLKHTENIDVGEPFYYSFEGDIRKHYNPTAYAVNMENLDNDFEYYDYDGLKERPVEWDEWKKKAKEEKKEEVG